MSLLIVLLAASISASAGTEIVRNGSFDAGTDQWILINDTPDWDPVVEEDGNKYLKPTSAGSYGVGTRLYQNLNVTGIAGKEFAVSMKMGDLLWGGFGGLDVYIEYVDTGNQLHSVKALTCGSSAPDWTTFTGTITMPSDARKLVKLCVNQDSYGRFRIDDISLMADGVRQPARSP